MEAETDRMKLRASLTANAAGRGVTKVLLNLDIISNMDVLQMHIEEVKLAYGEGVEIELVRTGANPPDFGKKFDEDLRGKTNQLFPKRTVVNVDRDMIDAGMTSPDIMEWLRSEILLAYGPHAVMKSASTDINWSDDGKTVAIVELLIPEKVDGKIWSTNKPGSITETAELSLLPSSTEEPYERYQLVVDDEYTTSAITITRDELLSLYNNLKDHLGE